MSLLAETNRRPVIQAAACVNNLLVGFRQSQPNGIPPGI